MREEYSGWRAKEYKEGPVEGSVIWGVSFVSSSTCEAMQGNLLSPAAVKVWGGFQAQLASGVHMRVSAFHHLSYFSLWWLHSQGRITVSALSSKSPGLGGILLG